MERAKTHDKTIMKRVHPINAHIMFFTRGVDLIHNDFQVRENISNIEFTPRFSLMLVFEEAPEYDWVMKYHDDDIVRFASWDHIKRSQGLFKIREIEVSKTLSANPNF